MKQDNDTMISIEQAQAVLKHLGKKPEKEIKPLGEILNRILAEDIYAVMDMPPFNKSAMDGYAISDPTPENRFAVMEVIAAGEKPQKRLQPGQCAKIMTGAMVPEGANRVIKVECTRQSGQVMEIVAEDKKNNICFQGEDIKKGDVVVLAGTRISPAVIGLIASMGKANAAVYKQPKVMVLTTGNEIKEPGETVGDVQIYNSNAYSLLAQLQAMGIAAAYGGIVQDQPELLEKAVTAALNSHDMIIMTGGVSMGDFDHVPNVLKKLGLTIHFNKIRVKPGKPTVFAAKENKCIFGLPGNPVSGYLMFEMLVKPFLYQWMGGEPQVVLLTGKSCQEIKHKKSSRVMMLPVVYDQGKIVPLNYHGSAHFSVLSKANAWLRIEPGQETIPEGVQLHVRSF
jgi:molybdopterin molybdotransferase